MLLPAFGLPYAVAVKHVFSPRTVLRRSLQYALARRTLTVLAALPAVPLVLSLVRQRDLSLAEIVTGRPLFYAVGIALLVVARKYREPAERWLDRRFFRAEYDAREILVSLAGRLPFETDPASWWRWSSTHIDSALHPESVAVLAEVGAGPVRDHRRPPGRRAAAAGQRAGCRRCSAGRTSRSRCSSTTSARARRGCRPRTARGWPRPTSRCWCRSWPAHGRADAVGVIALGPKQSEEPYTPEDRRCCSAIAAQMAWRSTSRASASGSPASPAHRPDTAPTQAAADAMLGVCPRCQRCMELAAPTCPDDGAALLPVPGLPPVVDGKYRVDALIGRGGMGAVFRARDLRLERDVAIKVVRADLLARPDARARFRREAQIVARLQHPAIVTVFDYGTFADGAAFLVMEFVRGEDLRQRLRAEACSRPSERRGPADGRGRRRRGGASAGRPASRPEAREHPAARERRRAQGPRLRRGQDDAPAADGAGGTGHARRHRHRHAGLHGAGTAARRDRRRARRRLQPRA